MDGSCAENMAKKGIMCWVIGKGRTNLGGLAGYLVLWLFSFVWVVHIWSGGSKKPVGNCSSRVLEKKKGMVLIARQIGHYPPKGSSHIRAESPCGHMLTPANPPPRHRDSMEVLAKISSVHNLSISSLIETKIEHLFALLHPRWYHTWTNYKT